MLKKEKNQKKTEDVLQTFECAVANTEKGKQYINKILFWIVMFMIMVVAVIA
jgi:hypothetical protein